MEKKGTERAVFVSLAKEKQKTYWAKEKKTYCCRAVLVCAAKEKKLIAIEQFLCVQRREKKTNRVPHRPGQLARHPAALRCDGPCRREQHKYTALPRQGVWAPTTTIALVRRQSGGLRVEASVVVE